MPEYEKITFENGFRLLLSEDGRAKSCSMGVWVGSGSCFESDGTQGISHFIEQAEQPRIVDFSIVRFMSIR